VLPGPDVLSIKLNLNMGRSQESFNKKEVRNRKDKKRKEKEQKKAKKKSEGKTSSFDNMIAYVDEFGMITSTPPDPDKKTVILAENIELKITKNTSVAASGSLRKGVVTFSNETKGFGFIRDLDSDQRVFFHASNLLEPVKENDVVVFETDRNTRGVTAIKVQLFRE
jgi:cold shock CspA family protein